MAKVKTLILAGGEVHDYQACGKEINRILSAEDTFEETYLEEDLDVLADGRLQEYDVLVFYYTKGELTVAQRDGLLDWVAAGNGFVGVHGATASFKGCPQYRAMIGGHLTGHPKPRQYQVMITDTEHPITSNIVDAEPPEFFIEDEMYVTSYDARNHVLARALWKDTTVPVAWVKEWGKGKVFWLALGHDGKACQQDMFERFLIKGTAWAGDAEEAK